MSRNSNVETTVVTAKPGLNGMILSGYCLLSNLKFLIYGNK